MAEKKKKQEAEVDPIQLIIEKFSAKTKAAEQAIKSNERLLELFADKEMPPEVALSLNRVTEWCEKRTSQALYNQTAGAVVGKLNELL